VIVAGSMLMPGSPITLAQGDSASCEAKSYGGVWYFSAVWTPPLDDEATIQWEGFDGRRSTFGVFSLVDGQKGHSGEYTNKDAIDRPRPVLGDLQTALFELYARGEPLDPPGRVFCTVMSAPDAPTGVVAVAGDGQATISFNPPASDGGSPITVYTVKSDPDDITATGTGSPIAVTGLANGTEYTFTVVATNAVGDSDPSVPSNPVTPTETPDPSETPDPTATPTPSPTDPPVLVLPTPLFDDNRLNLSGTTYAVYTPPQCGITVYGVSALDTGYLVVWLSGAEIATHPVPTTLAEQSLPVAASADGKYAIYHLMSGEWQVNAGPFGDEGKIYATIFTMGDDGCGSSGVHHSEVFVYPQ
jgi:hypothetical protein